MNSKETKLMVRKTNYIRKIMFKHNNMKIRIEIRENIAPNLFISKFKESNNYNNY